MKTKRLLKRKTLLKKLCYQYLKHTGHNDDLPVKFRIKNTYRGVAGRVYYYHYRNDKTDTHYSISINPRIIRYNRIKQGYGGPYEYYKGRGERIDPIIKNNYKQCLRFVILHEIGHTKFYQKYGHKHSKIRHEKYADAFALRYINEV